MNFSTTSAKVLLGAAIGIAVLAGCNKKAEDMPAPTANQPANPTTVPDPDMTKPGGATGGAGSDANPGGTTTPPPGGTAPAKQ